jgi:DNA-binding GntR family transcriptional regulator
VDRTLEESSSVVVNRVVRETLNDRVYEELKRAIVAGHFAPGTGLTLRALAKAVGTSEMPVRDAVRRLVVERGLANLPNRSFVVPVLDLAEFREITEIRMHLEPLAARHAAENVTPADIKLLMATLTSLEKADSQARYLELNHKLHFKIYDASRRPTLISMIESIWLRSGPLLNTVELKAGKRFANKNHRAAVEALAAHDGKAAASAIAADIAQGAEFTVEWMRQKER